ncbi:MAG TPA: glycogen debranching N-terminal domain-containing protein [Micromonosporaceae bacterium]|nr:glycogen debranching N-terminal domain-containing protein [Micromonosporaceae bacterium]
MDPVQVRNLRVRPDLLYVASGWSTLVTDVRGRITEQDPQGFYAQNTRVISRERITVDGREPVAFCTADVGAHAQLSYAELGDGEVLPSRAAYLLLERFVGEGLRTRLTVVSYADVPLSFRLGLEFAGDFADVSEAESGHRRQWAEVESGWHADAGELRLRYLHEGLDRAVAIRVLSPSPVTFADPAITVDLEVAPRQSAAVEFVVEPVFDGRRLVAPCASYAEPDDRAARARAVLTRELSGLRSTNLTVAAAWRTAVDDLASLPLGEPPGPAAPLAGLPIYQQFFGRDTLTVSWQSLLAGPTMLRDSLRLNAANIGQRIDDWRDEEPGKLLHQAGRGPVSLLGLDPFAAYYGDWATGPDFLVFLGQYLAWTGDLDTVRELLPTAHRVVGWLDRYGDLDRDGFLEYHCRSPQGVRNQGWKDSDTAVVDEHGCIVDNPVATSELQGYWYAALRHGALAFAAGGEAAFAARLVARAAALRRRFHRTYWVPELGSYAMALGPDKRPVRSVTSNDGHLLAAGIVPGWAARAVARRLLQPDMFSGWGIRTLSAEHPAYNPFSYHRGSVWPVEAGTIGLGLARYGCRAELHRVAEGMFAAAELFEGHRLPEVLSGLPRDAAHPYPGIYPGSCSPQAWSASTIVALVQALLVLRPAAPLRAIVLDPVLPEWLPDLILDGVQVGKARFDLAVRRGRGGRVHISTRGDRIIVLRRPPLQSWRGCR